MRPRRRRRARLRIIRSTRNLCVQPRRYAWKRQWRGCHDEESVGGSNARAERRRRRGWRSTDESGERGTCERTSERASSVFERRRCESRCGYRGPWWTGRTRRWRLWVLRTTNRIEAVPFHRPLGISITNTKKRKGALPSVLSHRSSLPHLYTTASVEDWFLPGRLLVLSWFSLCLCLLQPRLVALGIISSTSLLYRLLPLGCFLFPRSPFSISSPCLTLSPLLLLCHFHTRLLFTLVSRFSLYFPLPSFFFNSLNPSSLASKRWEDREQRPSVLCLTYSYDTRLPSWFTTVPVTLFLFFF